jgi:glutamyl-tRNA reductase
MSARISLATFAYPEVNAGSRAALAAGRRRIEPDGRTFLFETCLRTEVMVEGDERVLAGALNRIFGSLPELESGRVRTDEKAIEHLFRVATGLESPIRGEGEVFTQFRQTIADSVTGGLVDGTFARLLESAIAVAREARELLPAAPHDSLAAVAAQVVGGDDRVAVLGSGMMALAVVRALHALPAPPDVTVVARRPERVKDQGFEVWPFERAVEAVASFPAVVSATSAKQRIVDTSILADLIGERRSRLVLVDMAMPPDFRVEAAEDIRYLGIDDLARLAEKRHAEDDLDPVVRAGAEEAFQSYAQHGQIAPLIGGITQRADEVVERTVARFGGRLRDSEDLEILRQAVHTAARTLIANPISYVKSQGRAPDEVKTVGESFGVE